MGMLVVPDDMLFQNFAGFAQYNAASRAMVEFRAEFLFQRLDLPAQDRLADR